MVLKRGVHELHLYQSNSQGVGMTKNQGTISGWFDLVAGDGVMIETKSTYRLNLHAQQSYASDRLTLLGV